MDWSDLSGFGSAPGALAGTNGRSGLLRLTAATPATLTIHGPHCDLCRKYGVEKHAVFGSVLRDDFAPESDVDFLVALRDHDYGPWLNKLQHTSAGLGALLGREVDLAPIESVLQSENWIRRNQILGTV
jgi:uncharacterized protein